MTSESKDPFASWAILELMGHRRLAGYVQEVELAGHGMLRLDVPATLDPDASYDDEPPPPDEVQATQFYSPGSIYCLTPTTQAIARALSARSRPTPVQRWELPPAADKPEPDGRLAAVGSHDDEEEPF